MNQNLKRWDRYSLASLLEGEPDARGRLFLSELGQVNLQGVQVLHSGLDTVRQLFEGMCKPDVFAQVQALYEAGFGECMEVGGQVWLIGSGGASGYSFRLQNSDLGLIVFFKSRHAQVDKKASHVKIECSPHWLDGKSEKDMYGELQALAGCFLDQLAPVGVAVHLAVDVQGWAPPKDFLERLVTRARRLVARDAANAEYMDMGEVAMRFDKGQSYLVGSAASVQLACYRKDVQAKVIDKLDFWQRVWQRVPGEDFDIPVYDPKQPVWRIELRFHHTVLHEFSRGHAEELPKNYTASTWNTIQGVSQHLGGLWSYGLDAFRLESRGESVRARWLDPFWQFLGEDLHFRVPSYSLAYRRVKKTPGVGNERNLILAVWNAVTVYARYRFTAKEAIEALKGARLYDDLFYYLQAKAWAQHRNFDESEIFQAVSRALQVRILQGRAA